jgi:cyclopropane-fatty-acyl-phospholipid synthase
MTAHGPDAARSLGVLRRLLDDHHSRDFAIRLWDGTGWAAEVDPPRFTLVLNHPGALRRMLGGSNPGVSLGEAYMHRDLDVEGDLDAIFSVVDRLVNRPLSLAARARLGWSLLRLPRPDGITENGRRPPRLRGRIHSVERDRQAVGYHYDVSNDFYALWLDRRMVYSCAYFTTGDDDLDTAQEHKLDYICRKLRLQPGERLLDIGCGWGGLVMHAAQHYGVHALGITLSGAQVALANVRIRQAGLGDRCRVLACDYRELDGTARFDKLVSVGMFEHVGEALLPTYFRQAWHLLAPGGVFLNHGIARREPGDLPPAGQFVRRYVFPDGELVPISLTLRCAEETAFEVRDVESLREHYALTLRHWVRRLQAHRADALRIVSEPTYRLWELFMAACAHAFDTEQVGIYQTLLVKPKDGRSGLPLTRADWYAPWQPVVRRAAGAGRRG